jgi:hypothetical protein
MPAGSEPPLQEDSPKPANALPVPQSRDLSWQFYVTVLAPSGTQQAFFEQLRPNHWNHEQAAAIMQAYLGGSGRPARVPPFTPPSFFRPFSPFPPEGRPRLVGRPGLIWDMLAGLAQTDDASANLDLVRHSAIFLYNEVLQRRLGDGVLQPTSLAAHHDASPSLKVAAQRLHRHSGLGAISGL